MNNDIHISISTEISNISKIELFIEEMVAHYNLDTKLLGRITLPILEAINNAILYGNKKCSEKKVDVIASLNENKLSVTVEDEGDGFDYTHIPDPTLPTTVGMESGRGLFLMKTLSDELIFEKNGSRVTLVFLLD